jgi:hypothetical protein
MPNARLTLLHKGIDMSQVPISFPESPLSGAQLIARLIKLFESSISNRFGDVRPNDIQRGETWVDSADEPVLKLKIWTGNVDVQLMTVNTESGSVGIDASTFGRQPPAYFTNSAHLNFNPSESSLESTNVQSAINELSFRTKLIENIEELSKGGVIVGNADGNAVELVGKPNKYLGWDAQGNAVATTGGMPPGTRLMWPSDTPPVWGLVEDGGEYSRAVYASLFAVIGTIFGAGDGATTFNVPDSRNLFDRAAPAGGNVGVYQADAFASHRHSITSSTSNKGVSSGSNTGAQRPTSTTTSYSGDDETRPKNRQYLPIIVY